MNHHPGARLPIATAGGSPTGSAHVVNQVTFGTTCTSGFENSIAMRNLTTNNSLAANATLCSSLSRDPLFNILSRAASIREIQLLLALTRANRMQQVVQQQPQVMALALSGRKQLHPTANAATPVALGYNNVAAMLALQHYPNMQQSLGPAAAQLLAVGIPTIVPQPSAEAFLSMTGTTAATPSLSGGPITSNNIGLVTNHQGLDGSIRVLAEVAAQAAHRPTQVNVTWSPVTLTHSQDKVKLTPIQCLLREQIEVFQATVDDATTHVRGRNKTIRMKQIGIRCRHCASLTSLCRPKGSTHFPTSVWGFYQASQNMLAAHMFSGICTSMPRTIQEQFNSLNQVQQQSSHHAPPSGAGRAYWAQTAQQLGLIDMRDGVYCTNDIPADVSPPEQSPNESTLDSAGVYRRGTTIHRVTKRQRIV